MTKFREEVARYFQETTVHGLRYVVDGRNVLEKVLWGAVFAVSVAIAASIIHANLREAYKNPILTTIDTVSVKKVPFPAVTVDAGELTDPWGYVERALGQVKFACLDTTSCAETKVVRQTFSGLMYRLVQDVFEKNEEKMADMDLSTLEKRRFRTNFARAYGELPDKVRAYAAILDAGDTATAEAIRKRLRSNAVDNFATISYLSKDSGGHGLYGERVVGPAFEGIECPGNCTSEPTEGSLKEAWIALLQPFEFENQPFQDFDLGDFLAEFATRLLYSNYLDYHRLTRDSLRTSVTKAIHSLMRSAARKLGPETDMSFYELSLLAKPQALAPEGSLFYPLYLFRRSGCDMFGYYSAWKHWISSGTSEPFVVSAGNYWMRAPMCTDDEQDADLAVDGCCNMTRIMNTAPELMFRTMKYSMQVPHMFQEKSEFQRDFDKLDQLFPGFKFIEEQRKHFNPRVLLCQFGARMPKPTPDCDLFKLGVTNLGVGYTFNGQGTFKNDALNENFLGTILYRNGSKNAAVVYPPGTGLKNSLTLYLQLNKRANSLMPQEITPPKRFLVHLHDPTKQPDIRNNAIEIEAGYHTTVLVTPSVTVTTEEVRSLSEGRRSCRFKDEVQGLKFFSEYSQTGCILECQIREASNRCGCTPWNYPRMSEGPFCDLVGNACFEEAMSGLSGDDGLCHDGCPQDCNVVRYAYSASVKPMDIEGICRLGKGSRTDFTVPFYLRDAAYSLPKTMTRKFMSVVEGGEGDEKEACLRNANNTGIVQLQLATPTVQRITRDIRVTFADSLSNLGGTLGLFTGISILSMIELLYWLLTATLESMRFRKKK